MKEMIESFRAEVERTEAAHLRFITMRTVEARNLLDMLEQTSRAQRTDEGECKSAAAPVAGQAGLATDEQTAKQHYDAWVLSLEDRSNVPAWCELGESGQAWWKSKIVAAPVAADTEQASEEALKEMEARKDAAYYERNQVVAALAKCFPSGVAKTAIEGWSEDWHGCVYIDLPTGQVSWHFHDSQAHLFAGLPAYAGKWDGHDTPEKYRRVAALATPADAGAGEGLTNAEIIDLMLCADKDSANVPVGILVHGGRAIEREVLARMSTHGAPVTSAGRFDPDLLARAAVHAGFPNLSGFLMPPRTNGHITGELEAFAKYIAGQSPAPVTAEPAFYVIVDADGLPEFATKGRSEAQEHINDACDSDAVYAGKWKAVPVYTHSAPADRDAIREWAATVCESERVTDNADDRINAAYNAGCDDCAKAIRALKSMERAAGAKGDQQ